jgi:hypothetical protein
VPENYATVRLTREQLQEMYEKLYPHYREYISNGQGSSALAVAFVKVSDALLELTPPASSVK